MAEGHRNLEARGRRTGIEEVRHKDPVVLEVVARTLDVGDIGLKMGAHNVAVKVGDILVAVGMGCGKDLRKVPVGVELDGGMKAVAELGDGLGCTGPVVGMHLVDTLRAAVRPGLHSPVAKGILVGDSPEEGIGFAGSLLETC